MKQLVDRVASIFEELRTTICTTICPTICTTICQDPYNQEEHNVALDLVTSVVIEIIKRVIQQQARKSQAGSVSTRLQQAEIVAGYPRAFFHLCTTEIM